MSERGSLIPEPENKSEVFPIAATGSPASRIALRTVRGGGNAKSWRRGVRVKFSGDNPTVTEGPFDVKEVVCGFWIFKVNSRDEALQWAKRAPLGDGAEIEIRQIFEAEDFGAEFTPELRDQKERLRSQIAS